MRRQDDRRRRACAGVAIVGALLSAGTTREVEAQGFGMMAAGRLSDWSEAAVGSEEESYLRVLQAAGIVRHTPWSIRPLAAEQVAALLADSLRHPWAARARVADPRARATFAVLAPGAQAVYNSGFPFSLNDGAVWTGRGATFAARGGFAARLRPHRWVTLALRVEPQVAWAANASTDLAPNGLEGPARFADALEPFVIDAPQRFGDRPFATATLGQSTARLDVLGLTTGISTANQWIGPATIDPMLLGTNAGGFPHVFAGTARPVNLGVGTVHVRLQAGRLEQSDYSTVSPDSGRRLLTAATAVVTVRGVPGLEVGVSRLFHGTWPSDRRFGPRIRSLTQTFFAVGGDPAGTVAQNQLASVFGRWAFPGGEVYGEYLRNDASLDPRDYWQEPDHNSGWMAGARRVRRGGDGRLTALRFELLNTRITHLARLRVQTRPYQHFPIRQGHTERGQVLGSAAGQGGLAGTLGWDRYDRTGRWTVEAARRVVQSALAEAAPAARWDVLHYVRAERLRFGRHGDLVLGAALVGELNRNFGDDAYGIRLDAGWRFGRASHDR